MEIYHCLTNEAIRHSIQSGFDVFQDLLPERKDALILLKPNLNSHMNALAGNTTDLRILAACIEALKERGYANIVIGEGTNSGFYRNNISVINRLQVDRLATHFGVQVVDLNYSEGRPVVLDRGLQAEASRLCFEAELFINLPKMKTHFEAGVTVCMKNLIGCLIGQPNKKKMHNNLPLNIMNLNRQIKPHLHIIDAIIAMEGNGPTRGMPVLFGKILMGRNPFMLDYLCCRLMQIPWNHVEYLLMSREHDLLTDQDREFVDKIPLNGSSRHFREAKGNLLVRTIFNHSLQRYFQALRATRLFDYMCSTRLMGKLLFKSGIRQDIFIEDNLQIKEIHHDQAKCSHCGTCAAYCPQNRSLPDDFETRTDQCLNCLYCYLVCPNSAISVDGDLGFFAEQIRQYGPHIKKMVGPQEDRT